jgi:hypothetical protein
MGTTLRAAVATALKKTNLSALDRAHLERWASDEYVDGPIWQRLATAAHERAIFPSNFFYAELIEECLYFRGRAESVASGIDFNLRHNERLHQWQLELAKKADDLADYYKWAAEYSGIAMFFYRFFRPVGELEELHRREAEVLRRCASHPPRPSVRVSRQDRSGARKGLRKVNAFIDLANAHLTFRCSEKPDYDAIALLTEIAFPDFDADAEFVRKSLRPTTLAGRKSATRALATKRT